MSVCLKQCDRCRDTATVLLRAKCDCLAFAMAAEEMMSLNRAPDIGIIVRIDGFDVATQYEHRQSTEDISDCLF